MISRAGFDPHYGTWIVAAALVGKERPYASIEDMKNEHGREPTPDETIARADSAVLADAWARTG